MLLKCENEELKIRMRGITVKMRYIGLLKRGIL